jgi:hypothetical protein
LEMLTGGWWWGYCTRPSGQPASGLPPLPDGCSRSVASVRQLGLYGAMAVKTGHSEWHFSCEGPMGVPARVTHISQQRRGAAGCGWLTRAAELALWLSLGHSRALEAHRRCPHGLGQRQRGSGVSAETARAHSQRSSAAPTARSQPKGSAKRGAAARRHPLPSALP